MTGISLDKEGVVSQSQPCGEASADTEVFAGLDEVRAAALGRACHENGLGWFEEDGEMRFQPPREAIREDALSKCWEAVNALGGVPEPGNERDAGYAEAITAALHEIEKL